MPRAQPQGPSARAQTDYEVPKCYTWPSSEATLLPQFKVVIFSSSTTKKLYRWGRMKQVSEQAQKKASISCRKPKPLIGTALQRSGLLVAAFPWGPLDQSLDPFSLLPPCPPPISSALLWPFSPVALSPFSRNLTSFLWGIGVSPALPWGTLEILSVILSQLGPGFSVRI